MAYSRASNDIADAMISCVLVDDEDNIVDLCSNTIALDTGVAASVATGSWKGVARKYFTTTAASFNFNGVRFPTPPAANPTDADGIAVWTAVHGAANCSQFGRSFIQISSASGNIQGLQRFSDSDARGRFFPGGGTQATTTVNLPTDNSSKFSWGANYRNDVASKVLYGAESGDIGVEATAGADGGWGSASMAVYSIGGDQSQGSQPHSAYASIVFNRDLTDAEYDALHNDWFSVVVAAAGLSVGSANETDAALPIGPHRVPVLTATETDSALAVPREIVGISFVGGAVGTNTATLPAFEVGDIAVVFAFRDGSTTNPTIPGTFTSITNTTDGTTCSVSMGWRRLQSGDTTVGTWTNASRVSCVVYRGMRPTGTPVGAFAAGAASTSNTLQYPALTLTATNGTSWVLRCAGHRSTDQNLELAPSGFTNRAAASGVDGTAETAAHDTNGPVSSQTATSVTLTGTTSGRIPISLELLANILGGTLGINTETDAAQPIVRRKTRVVQVATETDNAITISASGEQTIAVTTAAETDSAQTLGIVDPKWVAVTTATETDAAQALPRAKRRSVAVSAETDSAQTLARRKGRAIAIAAETDSAQTVVYIPVTVPVRQPYQANRPRPGKGPFSTGKFWLRGTLQQSKPIPPQLNVLLGVAQESDTAQAITAAKRRAVTLASEADAAQPLTKRKVRAIAAAASAEAAQVLARRKLRAIAIAVETDSAQTVTEEGSQIIAAGAAQETDAAQTLGIVDPKRVPVITAQETDAAQTLTRNRRKAIAVAAESSSAFALTHLKARALQTVLELDSAQALTIVGGFTGVYSGGNGRIGNARLGASSRIGSAGLGASTRIGQPALKGQNGRIGSP